ncbi:Ig-like domain-containing protein [Mariniflexile ostreae]|uniref:Ig-like domain-containing protein n=1 Tax=Mariniflexile ostreae TaxID=1520892 RepID=A0ABV5F7W4_9FLAO
MNKTLSNFIFIACICLVFINCANRGTPQGGPKDITPPKITRATPKNYSINFNAKEIRIYFNEYIKIKDLQKQLIISPPMKTQPEITPLGGASEYIKIKIFDTLQPNTTYAFNFGNSIVDNNEGNPFPYFRYVFSTGDYIDSLSVKGQIVDAIKRQPETFVSVMLYEMDSTYNDSIVYKETPKYITNTLDSLSTFSIENVKAGKYMLLALKDKNTDYKFQQKTDKIGFYKSPIHVPTDSLYTLKLFSEAPDFKPARPKLAAGGKIEFGYEGHYEGMHIDLLTDTPAEFKHAITKDEKTDTLYYWYKPHLELDSLVFKVSHPSVEDTQFSVRLRKLDRDSLTLKGFPSGNIGYEEDFKISGTTPISTFDASKIHILNKDSISVAFTSLFDTINNTVALKFPKTESNNYQIRLLPEAFVGFFDTKNDTLDFSLRTSAKDSYGNLRLVLANATYPIIVQLTNEKGEVKHEVYAAKEQAIDFLNISPSKYYIRVVHDTNGNKKYDSGHYLKKIQPEKISHFEMENDVRAGWDFVQTLQFISE